VFERLTEKAKKVMDLARQEAQRLNSELVGTEHILLGICLEGTGSAAKFLQIIGADPKRIREEVEKLITPPSMPETAQIGQLPYSPRAKNALKYAETAAGPGPVGTGYLLWGLIGEHEGIAAQVLVNLGFRLCDLSPKVTELLKPWAQVAEGLPKGWKDTLDAHIEPLSHVLGRIEDRLKDFDRFICSQLVAQSLVAAGEGAEAERDRILKIIREKRDYYKEMGDKVSPGNDQNYWGGKRVAMEELVNIFKNAREALDPVPKESVAIDVERDRIIKFVQHQAAYASAMRDKATEDAIKHHWGGVQAGLELVYDFLVQNA